MPAVVDDKEKTEGYSVIEKIYREYRPWLLKTAYDRIPNIDICEDLFHDCLVNCIKHLPTVENMNDAALRRYLSVTMNNLSINYLKKNTKVVLVEEENFRGGDSEDETQEIENGYEEKFVYEQMMSGFDKLPEREKSLLMMKYNLRLRDNEIAPVFNIKEESVRMTIRRGMLKLKKIIKEVQRHE